MHEENISGIVLHTLTLQPLGNQKVTITVTNYLGIGNESSEFPNGQPVYRNEKFTLITNSEGKFELTVSVHDDWIYSAELERGEYEQKSPLRNIGFSFPGPPNPGVPSVLQLVRETYDTILAEQPTYVRYNIRKRSTGYNLDTLILFNYARNLSFPHFEGMNSWRITGPGAVNNDQTFIDTLPGESDPQIPVRWIHKNQDTIAHRKEYIQTSPRVITDYTITF